jgi:hypothetical protein
VTELPPGDSQYSITFDDGPRVPVCEFSFYAPRRSEFLGTAIPETVRVVTSDRLNLSIEPMRLRLARGGVAMLDTTAQMVSVTCSNPGDTVMDFELGGGKS